MQWHDIADPASRELDELAERYSLHPLHIEDCRTAGQRTKTEEGNGYIFLILTLVDLNDDSHARSHSLALFAGSKFFIAVHSVPAPLLQRLSEASRGLRPDQVLYRVLDGVVESYLPLVEKLEEGIEKLQDQVIGWAGTVVLERIAETRNSLMEFRRLLSGTRHAVFRLRHMPSPLVSQELSPFLRDVQDDLTIVLETTAGARDRLAGILDIYLSSVAHRTTEATRTLTLMGTIALPAIVITGFFGMAIDYPAWTKGPWMFPFLGVLTAAVTIFLVLYLKRRDYLPGGSTAKGLLKGPGPKPRELQ